MSAGAYLLARFTDPEQLLPAVKLLDSLQPIIRWDAVDGHVHLVIKTKPAATPDAIKSLIGLDELLRYDIVDNGDTGAIFDPSLSYAYVFIEAEACRRESVRESIAALSETHFCSATTGGCDVVAVIRGPRFSAVENTIAEKIRSLEGVLRLKHDRIIDLRQL
ncbi:MAG: Lrp/AsnC ligand binding domain-containing protein [Candidatus Zixiibacteriota bacterium]